MSYLVDANVLSEATRPSPHPGVIEWLRRHQRELFVDPILLGEMYAGILTLPRGRKRNQLQQWFSAIVQRIECLPWDATVGLRWAQLIADLKSQGQMMPLRDSMIAATALVHDLTVATRNVRDFKKAGVNVVDPFA